MVSDKMLLNVARLEKDSITKEISIDDLEHRLSIFDDQYIAKIIYQGHVKTLAKLISLLISLAKSDQERAIIQGYTSVEEMENDRKRMVKSIKGEK